MNITKLTIINELKSFAIAHPEISAGEMLYSFLRPHGNKNRTDKLSDLLSLTDDQILTNIEKAKQIEDND